MTLLRLSAALASLLGAPVSAETSQPVDGRVFFSLRPTAAASRAAVAQALRPDASVTPALAPRTVPYFEDTFLYGGQTYKYAMVGTNPKTTPETTRVPAVIVPIRFVFADGRTFDPSKTLASVRRSPLFRPAAFTSGATQYGDAIQRAEFWTYTQGTAYHVLLRHPATTATVVVKVPSAQGFTSTSSFGGSIGLVSEPFFAGQIVPAIVNRLHLSSTKLTIFWSYNVDLQSPLGANGAILGEHSAGTNQARSRVWTWAWASWHTADTAPPGAADIAVLSHEVAEWFNDPFGSNVVPGWEALPDYPCSNFLEVGDAVAGSTFTLAAYHLQDELFLSWFARQVPSIGIGGSYSYLGTLTAPPPVCGGG